MVFDFDRVVERRNTASLKWAHPSAWLTPEQVAADPLPMWVADMDFAAPPAVIEALHRRIDHGVFGYTDAWPALEQAVVEGLRRDHGWTIQPDWLVWLPGVVAGFNLACAIAGEAGDGVLTATPVYPPFLTAPANTGRVLQRAELVLGDGRWQWDWDALEAACTPTTRLLLLCSPHNPVGRVFDEAELRRLAEICLRHNLLICSDEIHADLVYPGSRHLPTAMLGPLMERFGLRDPSEFIALVYRRFDKALVASAAGLVERHRASGDELAAAIMAEARDELVGLVASVRAQAGERLADPALVLWGGLMEHNAWLRGEVAAGIARACPGMRVTEPLESAAYGACMLALGLARAYDALAPGGAWAYSKASRKPRIAIRCARARPRAPKEMVGG